MPPLGPSTAESPKEPEKKGWTPEDYAKVAEAFRPVTKDFIDAIEWVGNTYKDYKKEEREARQRHFASIGEHNRNLTYSLLLFLLGVIGIMSYLTWLGKVSGDALLFLVGTVTGYGILMVQGLTHPLFEEEEPPAEA